MDCDKIYKCIVIVGKDNYKLFFSGVAALDLCRNFVSI